MTIMFKQTILSCIFMFNFPLILMLQKYVIKHNYAIVE